MKSKIMKFFSDLGRSLMMPVAALAACGIILGITSALLKTQVQDAVPFLTASVPLFIITTLNKVSGIVFTLLPVLFAISIAFGLAKEDKGVAAFAGFIGYYTFLVASSCMISTGIMDFSAMKISNILGVDTVDMGALAGIMAGLVTAKLHNKYHKVQFPAAIAFYGGKRFVALVVLVSMTVIGLVMPLIWAPISVGIDGLGRIIRSSGAFGVFIFGTLERLLIPTGLHHVLEEVITSIDGVKEVLVVSEKHDLLGEVPVAKIVTDGTELVATEIISYCRQKLDSHKIPKRVIFCEKIEKTYNGKIKRG